MAVYKVLQDIEAEDKFLGPLTLRQFIYAAVVFVAGYIGFLGLSHGTWILAALLSPVMLFGGFLAWPWSKDQPTEVWLLAKIRFFLKPRRRIWDQTGMKHLVTITVPKKVEQHLTNGLSADEVQSRLKALAHTIDSRGWAIKNVATNLTNVATYGALTDSDRLIDLDTLPQAVPSDDIQPADDVLDEANPTAHHFDELITTAASQQHQSAVARMQQAATGSNPADDSQAGDWFTPAVTTPSPAAAPLTSVRQSPLNPTAQPDSAPAASSPSKTVNSPAGNKPQPSSAAVADPAIINLASNDDLNVATIARQANQAGKQPPEDEVVISLR